MRLPLSYLMALLLTLSLVACSGAESDGAAVSTATGQGAIAAAEVKLSTAIFATSGDDDSQQLYLVLGESKMCLSPLPDTSTQNIIQVSLLRADGARADVGTYTLLDPADFEDLDFPERYATGSALMKGNETVISGGTVVVSRQDAASGGRVVGKATLEFDTEHLDVQFNAEFCNSLQASLDP